MTEATGQELALASNQTAPLRSSNNRLALADLTRLPARLSDDMLAKLQEIVERPIEHPEPCTPEYLSKALMGMLAVLPRSGKDSTTGAVMMKTYAAKLGKFPKGAIAHLWNKSIEECQWFPTIAECISMANEWVSEAKTLIHARSIAASRISREQQLRFEDAMVALRQGKMTQDQVDALPDLWKRHAETAGHLWRLKNGEYRARPDFVWMTEERREEQAKMVARLREEGLL